MVAVDEKFGRRKTRRKRVRAVVQTVVLVALVYVIVNAFFINPRFRPTAIEGSYTTSTGFIALSYPGVDMEGGRTTIPASRLDEHLGILADIGFVSISQQDILNHYRYGTPLPEKALFLMFEDGRRNTANFAQPMLAQHNFQATMFTYANNLLLEDPGFIHASDMQRFLRSTYWEFGSQGYRLVYINVFDRHDNFLDILQPLQFQMVQPYLDDNYNHFLMDFIRDENGIPRETPEELWQRISLDYEQMYYVYNDAIGKMPGAYILMHSNSPFLGTHEQAGAVNAYYIPKKFDMHFNREGRSFNASATGVYDLIRVQVRPYWQMNHILMRISTDSGIDLPFFVGDEQRSAHWRLLQGAAEFREESIILTSPPLTRGLLHFNGDSLGDLRINLTMNGNIVGEQSVFLRADEGLSHFIAIHITDNVLRITEASNGGRETILYTLDLNDFDGVYVESMEENRRSAEARFFETQARFADTPREAAEAFTNMNERQNQYAPTVEDGAMEFIPLTPPSYEGSRELELTLTGSRLDLTLDGIPILEELRVATSGRGSVMLGSMYSVAYFGGWAYPDDIYSGIFSNLVITSLEENLPDGQIIFDNRLSGAELVFSTLNRVYNAVINWFIRTF